MIAEKITNHKMISLALIPYRGMELSSAEIREAVLHAFPEFNPGSHLPNDHSQIGNKSPCKCAGTERRLFDRLPSGKYLVLFPRED